MASQTRNQFLSNRTTDPVVPEGSEPQCSICFDEYNRPVTLPCKHTFCQECITAWLSRRWHNTCPTCRATLYRLTGTDRGPVGSDRILINAQAIEHSGLLTESGFDTYDRRIQYTRSEVQRATAQANHYLAETHPPLNIANDAAHIDAKTIGHHLIAMGNLLRGYAHSTGRPYSNRQCHNWKLIVGKLNRHIQESHGQVLSGQDLADMAWALRLQLLQTLQSEGVDVIPAGFFDRDVGLESPSADLDVLINYVVFQCIQTFQRRQKERERLQRLQQEALNAEKSKVGKALRFAGQKLFGGI